MPYLQIELDAKKKIPAAARLAGMPHPQLLWGLVELWEWCWTEKSAVVSLEQIEGLFGHDGLQTSRALVAFGFVEKQSDGGFRVKGAARYLRISDVRKEAGRKGGVASAEGSKSLANLKQRRSKTEATPKQTDSKTEALTPSTEHRAPSTTTEEEAPKITTGHIVTRPTTEPEGWGGEDFWRWFQFKRQEAGFVAEPGPPRTVNGWYSTALMTIGGNVEAMQEAVYRFGNDKHWQRTAPPLPWAAFAKCWTNFVPRGAAHVES